MKAKEVKSAILSLAKEGTEILGEAQGTQEEPIQILGKLSTEYQSWYSRSYEAVTQLMPSRLDEFEKLYLPDTNKRKVITAENYSISDFLKGVTVTDYEGNETINRYNCFAAGFSTQILIVQSLANKVDSAIADIRGVLQADLFDNELDAADELQRSGHSRAAGALSGVTLESHLRTVANAHSIAIKKKSPGIGHLNDVLKDAGVYDVPMWRFVQRLGDIRNLCTHAKDREPTSEEVSELVSGTDKVVKTIF